MKKCKFCKNPNPRPQSTCSTACQIALLKQKEADKKARIKLNRKNGITEPQKRTKTLKKRLKDEAWRVFSLYIRNKYPKTCVTCGKPATQAGHAVGGRGGYVLFNEKIVRPQCYGCNCMQKGKYPEFADYLINVEKSLTADEYFEIVRESHMPHRLKESDYEEIIKKYGQLTGEQNI